MVTGGSPRKTPVKPLKPRLRIRTVQSRQMGQRRLAEGSSSETSRRDRWRRGSSPATSTKHLLAKTYNKIYLVGSLGFVLCLSTPFWTYFGSIWTQVGRKSLDLPAHRQIGASATKRQGAPVLCQRPESSYWEEEQSTDDHYRADQEKCERRSVVPQRPQTERSGFHGSEKRCHRHWRDDREETAYENHRTARNVPLARRWGAPKRPKVITIIWGNSVHVTATTPPIVV